MNFRLAKLDPCQTVDVMNFVTVSDEFHLGRSSMSAQPRKACDTLSTVQPRSSRFEREQESVSNGKGGYIFFSKKNIFVISRRSAVDVLASVPLGRKFRFLPPSQTRQKRSAAMIQPPFVPHCLESAVNRGP